MTEITSKFVSEILFLFIVHVPNLENQEKDVKPSSPPKGNGDIHPAQTIVSNPMNTNNGTNQGTCPFTFFYML